MPKRFQPNYFNYKKKLKLTEENREAECSICLMNLFEMAPVAMNDSTADGSMAMSLRE